MPCMVIRNRNKVREVDDRHRLKTGEHWMFGIHQNKWIETGDDLRLVNLSNIVSVAGLFLKKH